MGPCHRFRDFLAASVSPKLELHPEKRRFFSNNELRLNVRFMSQVQFTDYWCNGDVTTVIPAELSCGICRIAVVNAVTLM